MHMNLRSAGILAVIISGACGRTRMPHGGLAEDASTGGSFEGDGKTGAPRDAGLDNRSPGDPGDARVGGMAESGPTAGVGGAIGTGGLAGIRGTLEPGGGFADAGATGHGGTVNLGGRSGPGGVKSGGSPGQGGTTAQGGTGTGGVSAGTGFAITSFIASPADRKSVV
jgi:hypothetical protein